MKKYITLLTSAVLSASILCGCASTEPQNGAPEERTVAASVTSSAADTELSVTDEQQPTEEVDVVGSILPQEVTVTSADNYAPSDITEADIASDPYAAGLTVGSVLSHNAYGELLKRYSSVKSEYAYKSTKSVDIVNVYTYFENNGESVNVVDYMGEEYIMVYINGMTYLKCIIDGQEQYYNIFAFSDDYNGIVNAKYLNGGLAEKYNAMNITKYTVNGGDYDFFVDMYASDDFISANADFYNVSKGDTVRECFRTDSLLNLKSTSMTIIHPDKTEEAILSRKLLYNIKMDMPDFVNTLSSPADPVRITFVIYPGTDDEYSETINIQKGTYLGTHYDAYSVYADEKCVRNAEFAGVPIEHDMTFYMNDRA